jgi:hypothetical protein
MAKEENGHKSKWTIESLKEMYDRLFTALEKRYDEKFIDADKAIAIAKQSAEKLAEQNETALVEYKKGANEFRDTLEDYRENMTPLREYQALEKRVGSLEIGGGRGEGAATAKQEARKQTNFLLGLIVSNGLTIIILLYSIFKG